MLNKNHLKLMAALTILLDHIGYILLPQIAVLRILGRISFPLYAFCIGDGCRYTKKPWLYLLRVFLLGLGCQLCFGIEELFISGVPFPGETLYLNVLFTFSLSIVACILYLRAQKTPTVYNRLLFVGFILLLLALHLGCKALSRRFEAEILFDYQLPGAVLPLFAAISPKKQEKTLIFSLGIILFALLSYEQPLWILGTLAAIPILLMYNEKPGKLKMKYAFYVFYPAQFLVLYGIREWMAK